MNILKRIAGQSATVIEPASAPCPFATQDKRWVCKLRADHPGGHKLKAGLTYGKK